MKKKKEKNELQKKKIKKNENWLGDAIISNTWQERIKFRKKGKERCTSLVRREKKLCVSDINSVIAILSFSIVCNPLFSNGSCDYGWWGCSCPFVSGIT